MSADIGNRIYRVIDDARAEMFQRAEQAQLTFLAFELAAQELTSPSAAQTKTISFPVGLRPDKTTIPTERIYTREDLLTQYRLLAVHQLAVNGLSQLVIHVESMLEDLLRVIVLKYPKKIGTKKQIALHVVLESASIDDIHQRAVDSLLNEISYESPHDFAKTFETITGVNLLECPAFHRYIEGKASRDIFMHNRGIANPTYRRKAGSHARVPVGATIPCDVQYFLECYEASLQLTEWLETEFHSIFPSPDFEARKTAQMEMSLPQPTETAPPQPVESIKTMIKKTIKKKRKKPSSSNA